MRRWLLLFALCAGLTSCGASRSSGASVDRTLTVFAAASLTEAFTELGAAFEAENHGSQVVFAFAGSQSLRTQIEAGAPADVFASADLDNMEALVAADLVAPEVPQVFATNQLAVILPGANPGAVQRLQDLATPGLKLVLASEDVPVGRYTRASLVRMNSAFGARFSDQVLSNVVSYEDNVRQVVAKVALAEADAGVAYISDATSSADLTLIQIPSEFNVVAEYPIAVLQTASNGALAQRFIDYLLSPAGKAILSRWGLQPAA